MHFPAFSACSGRFRDVSCTYLRVSLDMILMSSFAHKMDFAHNFSVDFF